MHGGIKWGVTLFVISYYCYWQKNIKNVDYSTTTTKYGQQIRVQLYFVAKHLLVQEDMEHARPNVYKTYLTSSSMYNHVKFLFILEIVFCLSNNFFRSFTKNTCHGLCIQEWLIQYVGIENNCSLQCVFTICNRSPLLIVFHFWIKLKFVISSYFVAKYMIAWRQQFSCVQNFDDMNLHVWLYLNIGHQCTYLEHIWCQCIKIQTFLCMHIKFWETMITNMVTNSHPL